MIGWLLLILPAAAVGVACGLTLSGWRAFITAAAAPWLGLLSVLLVNEYALPSTDRGASMWPVVLFFCGFLVALVGLASCGFTRLLVRRR